MANVGSIESASNTSATDQSNWSGLTELGPFQLSNNDHPGVSIVIVPFLGNNYLTWSTSIQISPSAKDKLCFIDGLIKKQDESSADFLNWRRTD